MEGYRRMMEALFKHQRENGDPHGQAAMSWICGALMSPRQQ